MKTDRQAANAAAGALSGSPERAEANAEFGRGRPCGLGTFPTWSDALEQIFRERLADLAQRIGRDDAGQLAISKLNRRELALLRADAHQKMQRYWRWVLMIHAHELELARRERPDLSIVEFLAARRG